jgi:hypothetical protein
VCILEEKSSLKSQLRTSSCTQADFFLKLWSSGLCPLVLYDGTNSHTRLEGTNASEEQTASISCHASRGHSRILLVAESSNLGNIYINKPKQGRHKLLNVNFRLFIFVCSKIIFAFLSKTFSCSVLFMTSLYDLVLGHITLYIIIAPSSEVIK